MHDTNKMKHSILILLKLNIGSKSGYSSALNPIHFSWPDSLTH